MTPSEELRFDFGAAEADAVPSKRRTARTAPRTRPAAEQSAEDLLAQIQRVQAAATKVSTSRKKRVAPTVDDDRAASRHPSRGPALSAMPEQDMALEATPDGAASEEAMADDDRAVHESESLTIAEFYARVKHALRAEFAEEVWVVGEIRSIRESRGHHYFELGDHDAEAGGRQATQQLQVTCWARDWPGVAHALQVAGVDLEVGRVVRVRGRVGVWDGASKLQFTLTALDIEALLGGIAAARRKLIAQLETEGLLRANARYVVPLVPLRVGVVTSPGTEAHRDFVGELARSGIAFDIRLEPSLVQGVDAPAQIAAALSRLADFDPDVAVVIRGGGARGDLACFDAEEVARAIATAPFPVWTGIGHTGDRAVADEVAGRAFITPTACGEAIVARVRDFWDEIERRIRQASSLARARLDAQSHRVSASRERLTSSIRYQLERTGRELVIAAVQLRDVADETLHRAETRLGSVSMLLSSAGDRAVETEERSLESRSQVLRAFDPKRQLERGWSLSHATSGQLIRSVHDVELGQAVLTRFRDGEVASTVTALSEDRKDSDR